MLSGSPGPRIRRKATGRQVKRNLERAASRRKILPGYPVEARAFNRDEIVDYFSGDRIVCLLCGKSYRKLAAHLSLHAFTEDDYRKRYGLPWSKGLVCVPTREAYAKAAIVRDAIARTRGVQRRSTKGRALRPIPPGIKRDYADRVISAAQRLSSQERHSARVALFECVLSRMLKGRSLKSVCGDPDMPSESAVRFWLRENPSERKRWDALIEELPWEIQSKMERLGPRFRAEVLRLSASGLSFKDVVSTLGVTRMTVWRVLRRSADQYVRS
jgi:predicted transcriptional regulator